MSQAASILGTCPLCGATVARSAILLKYEVDSGKRLYAECSQCGEPVQPE